MRVGLAAHSSVCRPMVALRAGASNFTCTYKVEMWVLFVFVRWGGLVMSAIGLWIDGVMKLSSKWAL